MIRSLLIKGAMLAGTVGAVLWMGWPAPPDPMPRPTASSQPVLSAVGASAADRAPGPPSPPRVNAAAKLDLNRASADELQTLPGIGAVLAGRVVEWRAKHGSFRNVEQLREVKGIGRKTLERVRPLVVVDGGIRSDRD